MKTIESRAAPGPGLNVSSIIALLWEVDYPDLNSNGDESNGRLRPDRRAALDALLAEDDDQTAAQFASILGSRTVGAA